MAEQSLGITPSQTIGPFPIPFDWEDGETIVSDGSASTIQISGTVRDGRGGLVTDAIIETWQADPDGRFAHPDDPRGPAAKSFRGFGRSLTDSSGQWRITTVMPGPLPSGDGRIEAPHIDVSVFARGLLDRVVTRIYFPGDEEALGADPVLAEVPPGRRSTLLAAEERSGAFLFDIVLQGERETVFFAI